MTVRYLDLDDFIEIAAAVTGLSAETVRGSSRIELADSALHAPQSGFGDQEFFPELLDKAAVLAVRLAKNHPLPDGNKRVAWVCLRMFVELNGLEWDPKPSVDETEAAVLSIANGAWDEEALASWLATYLRPAAG